MINNIDFELIMVQNARKVVIWATNKYSNACTVSYQF